MKTINAVDYLWLEIGARTGPFGILSILKGAHVVDDVEVNLYDVYTIKVKTEYGHTDTLGWASDVSGVELSDGRIITCATTMEFVGTDESHEKKVSFYELEPLTKKKK